MTSTGERQVITDSNNKAFSLNPICLPDRPSDDYFVWKIRTQIKGSKKRKETQLEIRGKGKIKQTLRQTHILETNVKHF